MGRLLRDRYEDRGDQSMFEALVGLQLRKMR